MLSVGELLHKTREEKGLSLKQIEKKTQVREKFLQAVENNDWNYFSSKVYITGALTSYAKALDLDTEKVLAYFRRDYEKREEFKFKKKAAAGSFSPETKKVVIALVAAIFVAFSIYFGYQVKLYLTPPSIVITSPTNNTFLNVDRIHIVGETEKEASITIYGEKVFADKDGVFEYDFPLKKGDNKLIIEVTGANGKKSVLEKSYKLE